MVQIEEELGLIACIEDADTPEAHQIFTEMHEAMRL